LGRLLHEFAVTIGVAILVSGFVSLSLSPMLCSRFLAPPGEKQHGRLYLASERFFDGLLHCYDRSLRWVLGHQRGTVVFSFGLLFVTVHLFVAVPKDFIPSQDTGQIFGFTEAAQGISFEAMVERQMEVVDVIKQDPAVEAFMSTVGATGASPTGKHGASVHSP